jgi:hypothetical protein
MGRKDSRAPGSSRGNGNETARLDAMLPGQRALGAMAEAARRAREVSTRTEPEGCTTTPVPGAPVPGPIRIPHDEPPEHAGRVRQLEVSILVLAILVLVSAIALGVSLGDHGSPAAPPRSSGSTARPPARHQEGGHHSTAAAASPAPGGTTPAAPAASVPPVVGNAPLLSALSPHTGGAGQVVVVSGANLMSADGMVLARFGGQEAPTSCPVQTSCTVTVPANVAQGGVVPVTITTDAGTSNALTFDYD